MNFTRRQTPCGFTVTELLVVITLIVVLVLIAVPSFSAMVYSSEEALAESQLRAGIRAARDAAVRSSAGNDGAAVFLFEPGGRLTILPCVKVGEINDWKTPPGGTEIVRREIFAAAPGFQAVHLPRYWMVRGFASPNSVGSLETGWYESSVATNQSTNARSWVFPETGFYNVNAADDGLRRSSFMVRFQAGTGLVVGSTTEPALVLVPRASSVGRNPSDPRPDREDDPARFIRKVLSTPMGRGAVETRRRLVGRASSDMVLAKPVMQLAVYNETKLAGAFGARLDKVTNSIYTGPDVDGSGEIMYTSFTAQYVTGGTHTLSMDQINKYIEGDTNLDGTTGNADSGDNPEARLYSVDRFTGALRKMEVQP